MKRIGEEELIIKLKKKDTEAFNYLVEHYKGALNNVVIKIVHSTDLTEEVLQDTFMKVWTNIADYNPSKGKLFTWMLNIAKNKSIDVYRSRGFRDGLKNTPLDDFTISHKTTFTPHETIGVRDFLKLLSLELRKVVDWYYFDGYTQQEISIRHDIPLGTVKTRLRTALLEIRANLGAEIYND